MKTVVVGASSGLGRCIAVGLGQRGAQVALLARRKDRIEHAATEAGPGSIAIACDVTDESSVRSAIEQAAEGLGGIDALVYASGIGDLGRLAEADIDDWRRAFDTNVIGASVVTAAALPHLAASSGTAAYLSSTSSSITPPWPGLGVYAVSKAALNKLVEAWRIEHPYVGFTEVTVGECGGGEGDGAVEFNAHWDRELIGEVAPIWINRQYMAGSLLEVDELVRVLDNVLRCGASASIPHVAVVPRPPAPA
jgi:NAD(P)-dependent dehydrogenase (short-subunit alcohol dehydrogenase family)